MYVASEEFLSQIKADNREFSVSLTFNSSTELTGTTIQKIAVDEVVNSTDVLTFGCACSNKITATIINAPKNIDYRNSFLTAKIGLKLGEMPTRYEYVPLGKFYVTDVQTTNDYKNLTITAFDGFCKISGTYEAQVKEETTLQAVYDDLKKQLNDKFGIVLKAATLPDYPLKFIYIKDITYTQAIAYVAGCLGGFARFDRYGELEILTYTDTNYNIAYEEQYLGGFTKLTGSPIQITSISTGLRNAPIVRGDGSSGIAISFENPYITGSMADAIYDVYNNFTYTPCKLKWRGNPVIQAGDIIHALDSEGNSHNVLVMSQNLKIGGGFHSVIDCKGKSEATSQFSDGFETSTQKLDRIYNALEQQIISATQAITGNSGGYVVLNDTNNDGCPDEILVMDSIKKEDALNIWRWNKEGLGHSSNGYNGPYKTAILANGSINADFITTGALSAERIAVERYDDTTKTLTNYIKFEDGNIVIGESGNTLTLKLENDQIAFYRDTTRIAYFGNNSFEIENLADGKIRFQDFGFIPRKKGNLTFTKLT